MFLFNVYFSLSFFIIIVTTASPCQLTRCVLVQEEGNLSIVGWFFFDEVMNGTCAVPPGWVFVFLFFS